MNDEVKLAFDASDEKQVWARIDREVEEHAVLNTPTIGALRKRRREVEQQVLELLFALEAEYDVRVQEVRLRRDRNTLRGDYRLDAVRIEVGLDPVGVESWK